MTIKNANMESCTKKQRVLRGPNVGIVYDPEDPCPDGYYWSEEDQDCLPNP